MILIEKAWHNLALLWQVCKGGLDIKIHYKKIGKRAGYSIFNGCGHASDFKLFGYVFFLSIEIKWNAGGARLTTGILYSNFIRWTLLLANNLCILVEFHNVKFSYISQPIRTWTALESVPFLPFWGVLAQKHVLLGIFKLLLRLYRSSFFNVLIWNRYMLYALLNILPHGSKSLFPDVSYSKKSVCFCYYSEYIFSLN